MSSKHPLPLAATAALLLVIVSVLAVACASEDPGLTCPAGQSVCGSMCLDLQTSTSACGSCSTRCPSGATCQAGACACPAGQTDLCGGIPGQCVDKQTDRFNCGSCGTFCGLGTCTAGACVCDTTPGITVTECRDAQGAQCANLANDTSNCGACRAGCATREYCVDGDADGFGACSCVGPQDKVCPVGGGLSACIDVWTEAAKANCGDCGHACGSTFTCLSGVCTCSGATPDRCPAPPAPTTLCTSFASNRENCGGCGQRCATGASCTGGGCACPGEQFPCGPSPGACTDRSSDEANCGSCGSVCAGTCLAGNCCAAPRPVCGAACCAGGSGCCGTGCQTAHSAGLPPLSDPSGPAAVYYDCGTLGAHSRTAAQLAAEAWSPAGGVDADMFGCGGGCFTRQAGNSCATWCYDGLWRGRVGIVSSIACQCPNDLSSSPWD